MILGIEPAESVIERDYRDYRDGSEFSLRVEFDTATEQLHSVYIRIKGTSADIGLYCGLLKKFYPKSIMD